MNKKIIALIKNILISARPNTWLRVWGEMLIPAALAGSRFDLFSFIMTFIATSPLLWTAGYMLNDLTDIPLDRQHPYRRHRPITTGLLPKRTAIIAIGILVISSLAIGFLINNQVLFYLLLLAASQILYTTHPIRLKERPVWDIMINAANSGLRCLLGWASQNAPNTPPGWVLLFFVSIKILFFIGHRMQNVTLEKNNQISSTVTTIPHRVLQLVAFLLCVLIGGSFIMMLQTNILPATSLVGVIGGLPLLIYLIRKKHTILAQETDAGFRNALYGAYFLWATIVALTIIWQQ